MATVVIRELNSVAILRFLHQNQIINVEENFINKELIVLMNADLEIAVAYLENISISNLTQDSDIMQTEDNIDLKENQGWKWRHYMAEQISAQINMKELAVKGIYLFGSTNNCTARLNSDIDLLIHFDGTSEQKQKLDVWLNGWSMALSEINFLKTGYKSNGLLDIHYVTDQDIADKNSFAIKINSIYDPALPLRLRKD